MIVQANQSVNLPGRSSTLAFIDVQSFGEQTGFKVDDDIYVMLPYPEMMTVDLPFSGVPVVFFNQGPAALSICLRSPDVAAWGTRS